MVFILSLFSASCPAMQPLSFFFFLYSKLLYLFFQRYRLVVFLGVLLIYALCSMESIPGIAFHCQLQCDSSFSPYSAPALVLVDKKYSPHVFSFLYFFSRVIWFEVYSMISLPPAVASAGGSILIPYLFTGYGNG